MAQSSGLQVEQTIDTKGKALSPTRWEHIWQLVRFGITGVCNAGIDILTLNILLWCFPTNSLAMLVLYNTCAYALGATNSYLLNKYWTFRHRQAVTGDELARFITINVIGILCNNGIFWLVAKEQSLYPFFANSLLLTNIAKLSAIIGTAGISYLGMHLWVFKKAQRKHGKQQEAEIALDIQGQKPPDHNNKESSHPNVTQPGTTARTFLTQRSLAVILPAYNEEGIIAETVRSVVEALTLWVPDLEVIVVNDGSKDNTKAIVEEIAKSDSRVRIISHSVNRGYGAALVTGFEMVTKELAFFTDADGQFDIHDLASFFPLIEKYDAVLGYRIDRQDTWMRKLNAWGWKFLVTTVFDIHVRDVDCAFKLYNAQIFRTNHLETRGAMINAEILYKLKRSGYTYTQLGVRHLPRTSGKATGAKPSVILRALGELFSYARKWRREELQGKFSRAEA